LTRFRGPPPVDPEGAARLRALVQALLDHLGAIEGLSALDLGAGTGAIAVELALRGAAVTAIEGRRENVERIAALAAERSAAGGVDVVEADVRELDWDGLGAFDVVVCSGLLYHLELPDAVRLARAIRLATRRLAVVDTELAWGPVRQVEVDGRPYAGIDFDEDVSERRASIGNTASFWLTRASLHALLHDAGFSSTWELGAPGQLRREQRTTVAALPGDRVPSLALDAGLALPDARPAEPSPGRLQRTRVAIARRTTRA
jgi:SAM-dependent methyltransferase